MALDNSVLCKYCWQLTLSVLASVSLHSSSIKGMLWGAELPFSWGLTAPAVGGLSADSAEEACSACFSTAKNPGFDNLD